MTNNDLQNLTHKTNDGVTYDRKFCYFVNVMCFGRRSGKMSVHKYMFWISYNYFGISFETVLCGILFYCTISASNYK